MSSIAQCIDTLMEQNVEFVLATAMIGHGRSLNGKIAVLKDPKSLKELVTLLNLSPFPYHLCKIGFTSLKRQN